MPISTKNKLAFIHIPKTAGSSILKRMVENDSNTIFQCEDHKNIFVGDNDYHQTHYTYKEISESCKKIDLNVSDYKFFTIIRNPYHRFLSALVYNLKYDNKNMLSCIEDYVEKILDLIISNNFEVIHDYKCICNGSKFCKFSLDNNIFSIEVKHLAPQINFVTDFDNKISEKIIILRYENLKTDIINNNLLLFQNLACVNKGCLDSYEKILTNDIKNKIYQIYEPDFTTFGYLR
jgi:hypothetical protein